tara:strand:+ start:1160 stop:1540 length:381 start_codon:yes stop_codon:yes gene_type:complete
MKKMLLVGLMGLFSTNVLAGPTIETYICTLNEGKTLEDVNAMVATFSSMIKKAGLQDSYTAHVGFQQIPAKANSVNWIGISPTPTDYGKAIEWFTNTKDGQKFGALYQSVYTCETSFMTLVTASSR